MHTQYISISDHAKPSASFPKVSTFAEQLAGAVSCTTYSSAIDAIDAVEVQTAKALVPSDIPFAVRLEKAGGRTTAS